MIDVYDVYSTEVHRDMRKLQEMLVKLDYTLKLKTHIEKHGIDNTFLQLYEPNQLSAAFNVALPGCEAWQYDDVNTKQLTAAMENFITELFKKAVTTIRSMQRSLCKAVLWLFDYLRYTKLKLEDYRDKINSALEVNTSEYEGYSIKDSLDSLKIISIKDIRIVFEKIRSIIDTFLAGEPDLTSLNTQLRVFSSIVNNLSRLVDRMPRFKTVVVDTNKKEILGVIDKTYLYVTEMLELEDNFNELSWTLNEICEFWSNDTSVTMYSNGEYSVTRSQSNSYTKICISLECALSEFEDAVTSHAKKAIKSVLNMCEAALS